MTLPSYLARRSAAVAVAIASFSALAAPGRAQVLISQIFGGGSSTGVRSRDYIELYNAGSAPVSLAGFAIQYATATGGTGDSWSVGAINSGVIQPDGFFLVQAGGSATALTPAADATVTYNLSATAGKIALTNNQTALNGLLGAAPNTTFASVVDFAGYGPSADRYRGAAPTAAPSTPTAVLRRVVGLSPSALLANTSDNNADFEVGTPNPRNSSQTLNSVAVPEPGALAFMIAGIAGFAGLGLFRRRSPIQGDGPAAA